MTNAELVAVAIGKWLTPIVKTIGGGIKIPVTSGIGKFMGSVFGLDLSTYNLLNELDFIISHAFFSGKDGFLIGKISLLSLLILISIGKSILV